jgi:hypothetical protein
MPSKRHCSASLAWVLRTDYWCSNFLPHHLDDDGGQGNVHLVDCFRNLGGSAGRYLPK